MSRFFQTICLLYAVAGLWSGCSTTPPNTSSYRTPGEQGVTTPGVDMLDYDFVMEKMASDMLQRDIRTDDGRKPVITLGPIHNKTNYNIETRMLAEKLRIPLLNSGKALFSTATDHARTGGESGVLYDQLVFQNQSGMVNPSTVKRFGEIIGADYILYGNIYNRGAVGRNVQESNFSFILSMTSVKTGLLVWTAEKQIPKQFRR